MLFLKKKKEKKFPKLLLLLTSFVNTELGNLAVYS